MTQSPPIHCCPGGRSAAMKAYVLGVGRSGTTALYVILQEIFSRHCRVSHSYYEPFLRNIRMLDGPYAEVSSRMDLQASLSIAGMLQHLRLPLLISDPVPYRANRFLRALFHPATPRPDVLLKFIRANGRFLLLRAICPEARAVFIIRNPVDVLNSLRRRFSLFGAEFHDDDYPRFAAQMAQVCGECLPAVPEPSELEKGLLFWYGMNRFALESFARVPAAERPLVVRHEELRLDPEPLVRRICDYLAVPYDPAYLQAARRPVGSTSRDFVMAECEQELFAYYLKRYAQLLEQHGLQPLQTDGEILSRYRIVRHPVWQPRRFPGLHVRALEREYEALLAKHGASAGPAKSPRRRACRGGAS